MVKHKGTRKRRTGRRKKTRTHVVKEYDGKTPRSLVVKRGVVAPAVAELVRNVRNIMLPHTMVKLKERKTNKLKDFTTVSAPLGVSHCMFFSQSSNFNTALRICCMPQGACMGGLRAYTAAAPLGGGAEGELVRCACDVPFATVACPAVSTSVTNRQHVTDHTL
jgi:hypothetical protein